MVVGRLNKIKVGFIIQARMQSTRLPNKVLMPIPFITGKPILKWIIDELNKSKFHSDIIIATSINEENKILEKYCKKNNIACFRGDEDNVLSRFISITKSNKFDVIVRLTGDNPIIDITILDSVIEFHHKNKNDYTQTKGLPIGMNFEIIDPETMLGLEFKKLNNDEKEHVTLYIRNNKPYKKGTYLIAGRKDQVENLRLTIDYPSDYVVLSTILAQVNKSVQPGMELIYKTLKEHPWLFDVNRSNIQKQPLANEKAKIREVVSNYKVLKRQTFTQNNYKIVPIRHQDMFDIMKWRNEQIYHLRQNNPLTIEDQNNYYTNTITNLFEQNQPSQILFSYLENDICIGYGGLVHINWIDKNAEISFIINTALEKKYFQKHWGIYLSLIEQVAFQELQFHKIYTYAFDLRPHLYEAIERAGYKKEATLDKHCYFEGTFKDVIIHSKFNDNVKLRRANLEDIDKTYEWASDPLIRNFSFNTSKIDKKDHVRWFANKIQSESCVYYIAEIEGVAIGSIRFDITNKIALISYLLNPNFQGRGLGKKILREGVNQLYLEKNVDCIVGLVFKSNIASIKNFESLGYEKTDYNEDCIKYVKRTKTK